ncbi:type 1 glutamine amidotransferase [bacterium]|nr:type 1 glutamine amidotransferase [bacterium]
MKTKIEGKRIAILVDNGFEHSEFVEPIQAIKDHGGEAVIVSPKDKVKSWKNGQWGEEFRVDMALSEASPDDFDGLVLPGGVINPDLLRMNSQAIEFVKGFFSENSQKPVAAICHGPWTLINAGVVRGRRMTSYESIKVDLLNAGAKWVDEEVVVDRGLVTSRNPDDLQVFCAKLIEEIYEGKHKVNKSKEVRPTNPR